MKNILKSSRHLMLLLTITLLSTSCAIAKLAKLGDQIDILKVENVALKGSSALEVVVNLRNDSSLDIEMKEAVLVVRLDGEGVATLVQIGEAKSNSRSTEVIPTLWKITNVEPMTLLLLASRIANKDLKGMSIDYKAVLTAGKTTREVSGSNVDISKLMGGISF